MLLPVRSASACFALRASASMVLPSESVSIQAGDYLEYERDELLGAVDSHELLDADNENGFLPNGVERDANAVQLVFVDETIVRCPRLSQNLRLRSDSVGGASRSA